MSANRLQSERKKRPDVSRPMMTSPRLTWQSIRAKAMPPCDVPRASLEIYLVFLRHRLADFRRFVLNFLRDLTRRQRPFAPLLRPNRTPLGINVAPLGVVRVAARPRARISVVIRG